MNEGILSNIKKFLTLKDVNWNEIDKKCFDEAKKTSDIVGILTRASFTLGALTYFAHKSQTSENPFISYSFGMCAMMAIFILSHMYARIFTMIFVFFASDVAHWKSRIMRYLVVVTAIISTLGVHFGLFSIVKDASSAISKL